MPFFPIWFKMFWVQAFGLHFIRNWSKFHLPFEFPIAHKPAVASRRRALFSPKNSSFWGVRLGHLHPQVSHGCSHRWREAKATWAHHPPVISALKVTGQLQAVGCPAGLLSSRATWGSGPGSLAMEWQIRYSWKNSRSQWLKPGVRELIRQAASTPRPSKSLPERDPNTDDPVKSQSPSLFYGSREMQHLG